MLTGLLVYKLGRKTIGTYDMCVFDRDEKLVIFAGPIAIPIFLAIFMPKFLGKSLSDFVDRLVEEKD